MDSKKEVSKYFNKYFKQQFFKETDTEFRSLVRLLNKAKATHDRVADVVGRSEQYHCELHDFGRKDKPCDKQCDGCKAMSLD